MLKRLCDYVYTAFLLSVIWVVFTLALGAFVVEIVKFARGVRCFE